MFREMQSRLWSVRARTRRYFITLLELPVIEVDGSQSVDELTSRVASTLGA